MIDQQTGAVTPFLAQDLANVQAGLDGINVSADRVAGALTRAFSGAVARGRSFDQTLQSVLQSLSKIVLQAGMQPLQQGLSSLLSNALGGIGGGLGGGNVTAFAEGGIVASPTYFNMAGGAGLMGEQGAEAIMPLARGSDGKLGVAMTGGGQVAPVVINISTPDVESFRQSQVQISGALARAVARGQRGL